MNTKLFLTTIFAMITFLLPAQELGREVISSVGGSDKNGDIYLSWTIGQAGLAGSSNSSVLHLNAGFEQELIQLNTSIIEIGDNQLNVSVFPNPLNEELLIEIESDVRGKADYQIISMSGAIVYSKNNMDIRLGMNKRRIPCHTLSTGTYILNVRVKSKKKSGQLKQIKLIKL